MSCTYLHIYRMRHWPKKRVLGYLIRSQKGSWKMLWGFLHNNGSRGSSSVVMGRKEAEKVVENERISLIPTQFM